MSDYPNLAKLDDAVDVRNGCVEFLDWLFGRGMVLCSIPPEYDHTYLPVMTAHERLAHEFLEIDEQALERERRAILAIARGESDA